MNIYRNQKVLSVPEKLTVLADAAKYDASCASSGGVKRNSLNGKGVGSSGGAGICHAYTPDGRCISLLKVLLTNFCIYDCVFCVNRSSSNVPRARFKTDELVDLTLDFYKRNYIEGLFLSSGIIGDPDYTMEAMIDVARGLREDHDYRGYLHLKMIPNASPDLVATAGRFADRLSINVELPIEASLKRLAPEKRAGEIERAMHTTRGLVDASKQRGHRGAKPPRFAPAGQSTQMIVGADRTDDVGILGRSHQLYRRHRLRRVYYSAFSPIPDASDALPLKPAPLLREHRLYQADWLLRFCDFSLDEIFAARTDGMLDLEIDPKLAWALDRRDAFPVDVNRAPREQLLRVPGLGTRVVDRLLSTRRQKRLRLEDVARLTRNLTKIRPFITALDWTPGELTDCLDLRARLIPAPRQLTLL